MPSIGRKRVIVTTSWDDGHPLDLRVADLLAKYGLQGTFYVPLRNREHAVMEAAVVRELSSRFEIGGHTVNHVDLTSIPRAEACREIADGKALMEDVIGKRLSIFAYPRGHHDAGTRDLVRQAGFSGARNASWFHTDLPRDRYSISPTLHLYPHSGTVHLGHLLKEMNFRGMRDFLLYDRASADLPALANGWLERTVSRGGIFHLWGHSWEIDELGLWGELEAIFRAVAGPREVVHVTNGGLLSGLDDTPC